MSCLPGPLLRCAPEISLLGGQSAEQGSWANYAQERERERELLHLGVERDIAESDIVHLPLPTSPLTLLSCPAGLQSPARSLTFFRHRQ